MQNGQENIEFGSGAHFDSRIALLRALTEPEPIPVDRLMGGGTARNRSLDGTIRCGCRPSLPDPKCNPTVQPNADPKFGLSTTRAAGRRCVDIASRGGLDFLVLIRRGPRRGPRRPGDRAGDCGISIAVSPGPALHVPVKLRLLDRPCRKANSRRSFRIAEGHPVWRALKKAPKKVLKKALKRIPGKLSRKRARRRIATTGHIRPA